MATALALLLFAPLIAAWLRNSKAAAIQTEPNGWQAISSRAPDRLAWIYYYSGTNARNTLFTYPPNRIRFA
jgi:hypothetical protein